MQESIEALLLAVALQEVEQSELQKISDDGIKKLKETVQEIEALEEKTVHYKKELSSIQEDLISIQNQFNKLSEEVSD